MMDFDDLSTIPNSNFGKEPGVFDPGEILCKRYEVLSQLGKGGMGIVYKCLDKVSGKTVALKTIAPELARNHYEMELTKENFTLVSELHHPYIANYNALEFDSERAGYYLVMEFVDGEDIRYYLRRMKKAGADTEKLILRLLCQAAKALDYAHQKKIVHKDIKPANMMVDREGNLKLLDFGLAAKIHSTMTATLGKAQLEEADTSGGTLMYMSPEQLAGKWDKPSMDQYSLAAAAYEMFSGHPPFNAPNMDALKDSIKQEMPEPLEDVSPAISDAVLKAMSKNPEDRFGSCIEFVEALEGKSIPVPKPEKTTPTVSQKKDGVKNWLIAILLLIVIGGIVAFFIKSDKSDTSDLSDKNGKPPVEKKAFNGTVMLPGDVKLELVKLPNGIYMGKYEVTQGQWQALMKTSIHDMEKIKDRGSLIGVGSRHPMYFVNWNDANDFCKKLNEDGYAPSGYKFTLPTESQWVYACRAGTTTNYSYGDASDTNKMNFNGNFPYGGGEKGIYRGGTVEVGSLGYENAYGLSDMHGNVYEMCQDKWRSDSSFRVVRGGGWGNSAQDCRSASRDGHYPTIRRNNVGFRVALVPVK